jgi:radical SAM superfamily enzyme YgiQ (UPF0313 family)
MLLINAINEGLREQFWSDRDNVHAHVGFEMLPLSIGYLGGVLEHHGVAVELRDDAVHSDAEIEEAITRHEVVGISADDVERQARARPRGDRQEAWQDVVVGGAHASCAPQDFLGSGNVDLVAKGESEETIVELMRALPHRDRWHQVAGIGFIEDGHQTFTPATASARGSRLHSISRLASPSRRALLGPSERPTRGRAVFESRLPVACTYCNKLQSTRKYRVRSPKDTVDEIEWLVTRFGVDHVYFPDDLFTLYEDRTIGICTEILERGLHIQWTCVTRVDCINPEMLRWMRKSGCIKISFGVESGSPKILKAMRKQFSVEQILAAAKMTRDAGFDRRSSSSSASRGRPGRTSS